MEKSLKFTSEKGYRSCVLQCFVTYFLLFWCGASWIEFLGSMVNFEPCCQVKENILFICLSSAREEEKSNFPNWSWNPGVLILCTWSLTWYLTGWLSILGTERDINSLTTLFPPTKFKIMSVHRFCLCWSV